MRLRMEQYDALCACHGCAGFNVGGNDDDRLALTRCWALRLRRRQSRREAVATHDLHHLCAVRWTTCRRVDHLGRLAEILRTYRSWRNYTERLHVLACLVIEPMNGAARNAERLSRPDIDLFSIDSPSQHSVDAVDRLLVMVVAVRWHRYALRTRDHELKDRDAATRVISGKQEAHRERPEADSLVGRIDVEVECLLF